MAPEDDDIEDLYDDEFDFVDDDDDESDDDLGGEASDVDGSDIEASDVDASDVSDLDDESELEEVVSRAIDESTVDKQPAPRKAAAERTLFDDGDRDRDGDTNRDGEQVREPNEEKVDEFGRPEPAPNFVVHIYEHQSFKRTIDRPFTPEDAEAFASEYNRTSKAYGRFAVAGKVDAKPRKSLD